jgi:hypothetical protein
MTTAAVAVDQYSIVWRKALVGLTMYVYIHGLMIT